MSRAQRAMVSLSIPASDSLASSASSSSAMSASGRASIAPGCAEEGGGPAVVIDPVLSQVVDDRALLGHAVDSERRHAPLPRPLAALPSLHIGLRSQRGSLVRAVAASHQALRKAAVARRVSLPRASEVERHRSLGARL
eukprot:1510483-Prymnesium_polylepis.1